MHLCMLAWSLNHHSTCYDANLLIVFAVRKLLSQVMAALLHIDMQKLNYSYVSGLCEYLCLRSQDKYGLCVTPDYNLCLCKILYKSVQQFLCNRATNIHIIFSQTLTFEFLGFSRFLSISLLLAMPNSM